ncbi:urea carboxylase [Lasius niger]|uniref:Urea carboxylase n=1 Tax=Lasius niger TaxID=67767 RepID=A0A0J7KWH1_LASNI|nr:urea carboxylase [Lasius niger]
MRLPKKTKWVKKKNERPEGWQTCLERPQGRGWCSCLLNGATLRTPDEWTGGGADISTVIYHPARPARKLVGPATCSLARSLARSLCGHGPGEKNANGK